MLYWRFYTYIYVYVKIYTLHAICCCILFHILRIQRLLCARIHIKAKNMTLFWVFVQESRISDSSKSGAVRRFSVMFHSLKCFLIQNGSTASVLEETVNDERCIKILRLFSPALECTEQHNESPHDVSMTVLSVPWIPYFEFRI